MNEYTIVAPIEDEVQAELVEAILSEHNIPHLIINYHDSAFDGLFSAYQGWGCIKAPPEYHEEIQRIIETIKAEKEIPTPPQFTENDLRDPDEPE